MEKLHADLIAELDRTEIPETEEESEEQVSKETQAVRKVAKFVETRKDTRPLSAYEKQDE